MSEITRVEVVDENWRAYVNNNCEGVALSYQDEWKTLKIFLTNTKWQ